MKKVPYDPAALAAETAESAAWFNNSDDNGGSCVDVALPSTGGALLRDSTQPTAAAMSFNDDEWDAFIAGVKAGKFDRRGARPA